MLDLTTLTAALFIAFALRQSPGSAVLLSLSLWVLVPEAFTHQVFSGVLAIVHPAALLAITAVVFNRVDLALGSTPAGRDRPRQGTSAMPRSVVLPSLLAILLLAGQVFVYLPSTAGAGFAIDQILGSIALVWLTLSVPMSERSVFRDRLLKTFVALATLESLLAIAQSVVGWAVPYRSYYSSEYWWFDDTPGRWLGTLDHPLILGVLLAVATFFLASVERVSLRFTLAILFVAGTLTTQSRTGIVAIALALTYLIFISRMGASQRAIALVLVAASSSTAWSVFAASSTYSRFSVDANSGYARRLAYSGYFNERPAPIWPGDGPAAADRWSRSHGLISSLENPLLIFSLNYGLAFTVAYIALAVTLLVRAIRLRAPGHVIATGGAALALSMTFSSLATPSALPALVWLPLAAASLGRQRTIVDGDPEYSSELHQTVPARSGE